MSNANLSFKPPARHADDHSAASMDMVLDRPVPIAKDRVCLSCGSTFPSEWAGERVCRRCKGTNAWRTATGL